MRRGELLALRWHDVQLLDGHLTVREALVKGRFTTPKSKTSRRLIELGPRTKQLLAEHWQHTTYNSDDDLVFAHPTKRARRSTRHGSPANTSNPHSKPPGSRNRSGPSTTSATPPSPTKPPPATHSPTSK